MALSPCPHGRAHSARSVPQRRHARLLDSRPARTVADRTLARTVREASTRPNAFARLYRNEGVTAQSSFVSMQDFDACTNAERRPTLFAPEMPVWIGLDASVRHDQTALVAVTNDPSNVVRLVNHKVFRPSPGDPLDFENTIIATLNEWSRAYRVRKVLADPWQLESIIQGLQKDGLPIEAYNQTVPGLTEVASNLFQLIRSRTLQVYPDPDMRRSVLRGIRIRPRLETEQRKAVTQDRCGGRAGDGGSRRHSALGLRACARFHVRPRSARPDRDASAARAGLAAV